MAETLAAGRNAVLFYDDERLLEDFLFRYVKTGLKEGQPVIYLAGIRTPEQVRHEMSANGINPDSGNLSIMRYDDVFLKDGRFDPFHVHQTLFKKAQDLCTMTKSRHVRLATESNWWHLADLFEQGLETEEQHDLVPSYLSVVCTYNIIDLLKHVSTYHLAKLSELHETVLLISSRARVAGERFQSSIHTAVMEAIDEISGPVSARNLSFKSASDLLENLQSTMEEARMIELEKRIEEKLFEMLNRR